jgi:hypothetical protein
VTSKDAMRCSTACLSLSALDPEDRTLAVIFLEVKVPTTTTMNGQNNYVRVSPSNVEQGNL